MNSPEERRQRDEDQLTVAWAEAETFRGTIAGMERELAETKAALDLVTQERDLAIFQGQDLAKQFNQLRAQCKSPSLSPC